MAGAGQPYSVRFMTGRGTSRRETYTVPVGKRAVVRSVAFLHWTTVGQSSMLFVHGISAFFFVNQAANEFRFADVRLLAYAGETIFVQTSGADVAYTVSGFLYYDDATRPDDADNVITPMASTKPG